MLVTKQNRTNVVFLKVQDHTVNFAGELQKLTLHCILKSVHTSDAVRHLNNRTHLGYFQLGGISLNLILND